MQIRENRCDVAEPRFLCDHPSKSVLDTLKASQIWNEFASQERIAEIKSGANYCCSYGFGSLSSERSKCVLAEVIFIRMEFFTFGKICSGPCKVHHHQSCCLLEMGVGIEEINSKQKKYWCRNVCSSRICAESTAVHPITSKIYFSWYLDVVCCWLKLKKHSRSNARKTKEIWFHTKHFKPGSIVSIERLQRWSD